MNGVRSTFMRRGYLLTALSALLLLVASVGTAEAQVIDFKDETLAVTIVTPQGGVAEGSDATITVRAEATVLPDSPELKVTVPLELMDRDVDSATKITAEKGQAGQIDDAVIISNPTVVFTFPANTTDQDRRRTYTQTITVRTNHDADAEDEVVGIQADGGNAMSSGGATATVTSKTLRIIDDETQAYKLSLNSQMHHQGNPVREGETINVNLAADPPHYDGGTTLQIYVMKDGKPIHDPVVPAARGGYTVAASTTIGTADFGATDAENQKPIQITAPMNDGNRTTDTITLEVDTGANRTTRLRDSLDIDVRDIHNLPAANGITAVAKDDQGKEVEEIEEGGDPIFLTVTVNRATPAGQFWTDEELTLDIRVDDPGSYEVSPARTTVGGEGQRQAVAEHEIKISARNDENVNDDELEVSLVVSGNPDPSVGRGSGESVGTFTIAVADDTAKKVEPRSEDDAYGAIMDAIEEGAGDEGLNPGESFMVYTKDLFDVMEGYTASYGVAVEGDPAISVTASTDSITVDAKSVGESKVTVTATAKAASSSFMADQSVSNVASITFPVTVTDKMLTLMIEMPDNVMEGNVVEGMSYHIPVMTNRAVHEDTMVTFMRDRAQSDADEDDYSIGDVTIMAGEMEAMAELMVTEDMMDDAGHAMGEQLVIYAMAGDVESNELMFTIWDEAVPALPLIAQLLLALFLMAGGARLYRRRQS